jgi:hypothetical protein
MSWLREEVRKLPAIGIVGLSLLGTAAFGALLYGVIENRVGILYYLGKPWIWFLLVGGVSMFLVIAYFAKNWNADEGDEEEEDEENPIPPISSSDEASPEETPEEKQAKKVGVRFRQRVKEVWTERKELGIPFLILYVLLNLIAIRFFWSEYRFLMSIPGFFTAQLAVIMILAVLAFFEEHKVLKGMAIFIVVLALMGYSKNLYQASKGSFSKPRAANDKGIITLPENLPSDTSFVMKVSQNEQTPFVVLPDYTSARFTIRNYTHCVDVIIETGEKVELCGNKKVEIPEFRQFAFIGRMPKTEVKVRLCDWRVHRIGFPVCPIPLGQNQDYPVREYNPVVLSQSSY